MWLGCGLTHTWLQIQVSLAVLPWASHSTSWSLSFFISKLAITSASEDVLRIS